MWNCLVLSRQRHCIFFQVAGGGASSHLQELESAERKILSSLGNGGTSVSLASSVPGELWSGGGRMERSASYQLNSASGLGSGSSEAEERENMTREKSHHTLAELKRQRAAAKLNKYPAPAPPLPSSVEEEEPTVSSAEATSAQAQQNPKEEEAATLSQVYFTPASGDPPLLKLIAPEEEQSNNKEPCCGLM